MLNPAKEFNLIDYASFVPGCLIAKQHGRKTHSAAYNIDLHHRSYHDIRALGKSADAGRHLCSLIFGRIDSSDLERMHNELLFR